MADEEKTGETLEPDMPSAVAGTLEDVAIEEEMSRDYIDYSMSVIVGRALPDVRDGLKPVHRRCLYSMYMLDNTWNKKHLKSARIVGDVIGKYHPHGDTAVYDTIVRMAQPFSLRVPLVDGHGNFGSIDGDGAAAMRYTEVRMQRVTEEMLGDLEKDTVDMMKNFDETLDEPTVLPAKLPNLLLNGSSGIAVGMATNIPPHNLGELCDGITYYIDHRDCTIDDLMQFVKGPDFPTGAQICGRNGIIAMYKLGRGQLCVRGHAEIEEWKNDRQRILITSLPYQVNKAEMIKHAAELVKDKVIEGISDIRDESKADVRIVVELKRDAVAQIVLNQQKREDFYDACCDLVRRYVAIATQMEEAGYTEEQSQAIYQKVKTYDELRTAIMHRCGDYIDLKAYDAEMRALLDDYVTAPRARVIEKLDDFSFLDIITVDEGPGDDFIKVDPEAEEQLGGERGVAETMVSNTRRVINRKRETNPEEYHYFSEKIDRLLEEYQQQNLEYKELLRQIVALTKEMKSRNAADPRIDSELKQALYDNLGKDTELALNLYNVIAANAQIGFRENQMRKKKLNRAIANALNGTEFDADKIMSIVVHNNEF